MRIFGIIFVLVALVASGLIGFYLSGSLDLSRSGEVARVQIGQVAPDFELQDKSGKRYSLSFLRLAKIVRHLSKRSLMIFSNPRSVGL